MVRTARIPEDPDLAAARQTASLAGLALTLALVVAGLFLVQTLREAAIRQDCGGIACSALRFQDGAIR
jgi:predicted metal-binding membrane protein